MSYLRFFVPVIVFIITSFATLQAVELGDPSDFALRFDETTGNLSELVYKGETVTLPMASAQRFDILQNDKWAFGLAGGKLELLGIKKESDSTVMVTQKIGDWTVTFRYVLSGRPTTLSWNAKLMYTGKEPTKIKSFWMAYPLFPFGDESEFIVPGLYPPRKYTSNNFAVGAKQGIWRSGSPLVFQLDKTKSVLLFSDQLHPHADRPGGDISRNENGVRLVQSFSAQGHVQPGLAGKQVIGGGSLRIVDGDVESALLKLHDLMRHFGHVVPKDRPQWFKEAIAYSMHPGGTTGSQCKDLGGFLPTLKLLPRIKELGCNVIWFMPLEDKSIYWPRDYYKLQSGLGSTDEKAPEEYKAVVKKAHELGMRVVQDSVPHGGGNTNDRAKEHPYWLAQNEDGSTLDYWCFDFNWPSWIDYMAEVSRFYVKTYGIDGFRIDACGGSKIPNWNPEIPYSRASHSQSQGGLNMVRAIRKALKDEKPDGATLAEVNGSLFGAVSDAVYDFDLCYNVLHDARKQMPEEFVKRIRRWLHEQQYSEIPDLLRLRHVESHDSLRAQRWYGTRTHRNLVALTAYIHGIPLVYHDEEIGHGPEFKRIFEIRKALPELNGGAADYLCVETPPGVFGCLRTCPDGASVVLIDFTENEDAEGVVSLPWNSLPEELRNQDFVYCQTDGGSDEEIQRIEKTDERLRLPFDGCCGSNILYVLRKNKEAFDKNGLSGKMKEAGTLRWTAEDFDQKRQDMKSLERFLRFNVVAYGKITEVETGKTFDGQSEVLFVDPETGLPACYTINGFAFFGEADLLLPAELKDKAEKPVIEKTDTKISVRRKFGDATLEIDYTADKNRLNIESRWTGKNIPKNAALSLPVLRPLHWHVNGFHYQSLPPRRVPAGFYGSIYWRPQGTDLFYDSVLDPLGDGRFDNKSPMYFTTRQGGFHYRIGFGDKMPIRFRQQGPMGENKDVNLIFSWTDEGVPQLNEQPMFSLQIGRVLDFVTPEEPRRFREVAGGWIFENEYYKLRLARNGMIMSLHKKGAGDGAIAQSPDRPEAARSSGDCAEYGSVPGSLCVHQGDLYSDYGYGKEKTRYAAGNDVEAGCRIVQDGDTLRLRFEGQLRGMYRFDLMRPPVEYFMEYALNDGSAFAFSCGVKTHRIPTGNRAFLALMLPMPTVERFEYFKDGKPIAEGNNVDAKGRSYQCRTFLPDRVLLKDDKENLLELAGLKGEASNLFLDRKNFFVTFDDGENLGTPGQWRSFSATISASTARGPQDNVPKVTASRDLRSQTNSGLLVDGGFEALSSNDLVSLRTGNVLKGQRGYATGWQVPPQGSVVTDVFRSGKSSARVVGETAQYRHFEQDVAVKNLRPGQKLRLTVWAKGEDLKRGPESWQIGSVRFVATVDGKQQYISAPPLLGSFDWKEVSVEFTVPEKLGRLSVQVGVNGAAGTIWIDDARLETLP